jgi:hypothetical protein
MSGLSVITATRTLYGDDATRKLIVTTTNLPYAGFLGPAALAIATALQSWNPTSELSLKAKARDTLEGHLDRTALRVVLGEPIDRDEFSRCLQEILREHEGHL